MLSTPLASARESFLRRRAGRVEWIEMFMAGLL